MMTPEQSEQAAESLLDQPKAELRARQEKRANVASAESSRCRRRDYDNCCAGLPGKHPYLFAGRRRSWRSFWVGGTQRLNDQASNSLVIIADTDFPHFRFDPVLHDEIGFFWRTTRCINLRANTKSN